MAVCFGAANVCPAQELKPMVTVSFSGYDETYADLDYIGKLADNEELASGLEEMLQGALGGADLAGLDKSKPWGVAVQIDAQGNPAMLGFVPVTDLHELMKVVKDPESGMPLTQRDGDDYKMGPMPDGTVIQITQKGNWAFVVTDPKLLDAAPADPTALLGGMNEKYDLAARLSVQNVPAAMREEIKDQIKQGASPLMQPLPNESQDDFRLRSGLMLNAIDQFTRLPDELDTVLLGFAIDRDAGTSFIDLEITAVEGSKTAEQFALMKPMTTKFGGFNLPGAAVTLNGSGALSDDDVSQLKSLITSLRGSATRELNNQGLSPEELQFATQMLTDVLDWAEATIDKRVSDVGMSLVLRSDAITLIAGAAIAEGAKLEKVLKQLAELAAEEDPDIGMALKMDAETYDGVHLHTLTIPVPDEDAVQFFGDALEIVVGIGPERLYVAGGRDAMATLKTAIDNSKTVANKTVSPMRLSIAGGPIARFAADLNEGMPAVLIGGFASQMEQSGGKDHLTITADGIADGKGMRVRIEVEEGLLKIIGGLSNILPAMMVDEPPPF